MKITVYVKAGAKEERIEKIREKEYKVRVKEKPKENKANFAVIKLLAKYFQVPPSLIKLSRGEKSKRKVFEIE